MPPRRSGRVAAIAEARVPGAARARAVAAGALTPALAPLPRFLALHVFSLLPVDCRLRCAEVCRGWLAALEDPLVWTHLDVSAAASLARPASPALLASAAARAGGRLVALDVHACNSLSLDDLAAVLRANPALQQLRLCPPLGLRAVALPGTQDEEDEFVGAALGELFDSDLEEVLAAAPALRELHTDAHCENSADGTRLLRGAAPFGALRLRTLQVDCWGESNAQNEEEEEPEEAEEADDEKDMDDEATRSRLRMGGISRLTAALAAQSGLRELLLFGAPLEEPGMLEALVAAALRCRLPALHLEGCPMHDECAPVLAHLLSGDALTSFALVSGPGDDQLLVADGAADVLAAALAANSTLTRLALGNMQQWRSAAHAATLLGALTGHASLRSLALRSEYEDEREYYYDAGAIDDNNCRPGAVAVPLLAALLAADAPALRELDVVVDMLNNAELAPLAQVLARNTHLRSLRLYAGEATDACARKQLLPALRANAGLRSLQLQLPSGTVGPAAGQAMRLVNSRGV
jgi:hypothetical protein